MGTIQKDLGKLSEAELSLRKSIELNPDSANAYSNLGNVLRELKKFNDAEISLRKAIEIDPNSIIGYANLGNMLKTIGRVKEAKILLIKTIEINPEFVKPYYSLSRLKYESSDKTWRDYLFSKKFLTVSFGRGALVKRTKSLLFFLSSLRVLIAPSWRFMPLWTTPHKSI